MLNRSCFTFFLVAFLIGDASSAIADPSTNDKSVNEKTLNAILDPSSQCNVEWKPKKALKECNWSKCQKAGLHGKVFEEGRFTFWSDLRCYKDGQEVHWSEYKSKCSCKKADDYRVVDCENFCYQNASAQSGPGSIIHYSKKTSRSCQDTIPKQMGCFTSPAVCYDKIKYDSPWSRISTEVFLGPDCNRLGHRWGNAAKDHKTNELKFGAMFCLDPDKENKPVKFFNECAIKPEPSVNYTESIPLDIFSFSEINDAGFKKFADDVKEIKRLDALVKRSSETSAIVSLTGTWELVLASAPSSGYMREVLVLVSHGANVVGYSFVARPVLTRIGNKIQNLEMFRVMQITGFQHLGASWVGTEKRELVLLSEFPMIEDLPRSKICKLTPSGELNSSQQTWEGNCEVISPSVGAKNIHLTSTKVILRPIKQL